VRVAARAFLVAIRVFLVLVIAVGVLFIGQGVGLVPGSFMTGRSEWAVIGSVLIAVAVPTLWWITRARG
jgi:hypothetical protein